ncbi:calcium release-activated calcium channel protein 1-like isoform X2 [Ischnura elegans]|nr:calcium release-activated calcium channel protein 1-like isoform X2 [Ischnura elegans]XP_046386459.1 calcium release-activated calcium channel protein 1-like isoform X2 [Ischnura elegans]
MTEARNLWNTALAATVPSQNRSSPMLTTGGYWGSSKTLRDDMEPIPHSHSFTSVNILPGDPGPRRSRESSVGQNRNLTPEGLSWKRLHMSRAKLKATATTSELLSGFAMVAMVELQINEPTNVPEWLFVVFAVCTTVLVSVHIFALMISTYILPNVDAVSKMQHMASSSKSSGYSRLGGSEEDHSSHMGNILESPHERMRNFIELAWAFSTVLGLFLFLVELAILCWVKFWDYSFTAAWSATAIVIPVLVLFVVFVTHFYRTLVEQKVVSTSSDLENLEAMHTTLRDVEVGCYDNPGCTVINPGPPSPAPSVMLSPPSPTYSNYPPHQGSLLVVPDSQNRFLYPSVSPQRPSTPNSTRSAI